LVYREKKDYIANDEFVTYLGIPLGSKSLSRKWFHKKKIQGVLTKFDQLGAGHLTFNQILKVIKSFITPSLSYVFCLQLDSGW
jgi:Ca2+-binding EF-hand superfamily protein